MRARACFQCKEYMLILPNHPENQNKIKNFERIHSGHAIITVDYFEIKDDYKRFEFEQEVVNKEVGIS